MIWDTLGACVKRPIHAQIFGQIFWRQIIWRFDVRPTRSNFSSNFHFAPECHHGCIYSVGSWLSVEEHTETKEMKVGPAMVSVSWTIWPCSFIKWTENWWTWCFQELSSHGRRIFLFIRLFIYFFIYLFIYLFIHIFVYFHLLLIKAANHDAIWLDAISDDFVGSKQTGP